MKLSCWLKPSGSVFWHNRNPVHVQQAMAILFRLWKIFAIILGVFTISVYAVGSLEAIFQPNILPQFLRGLFSLFFILCAGYLMNDLCDIKYDLKNRPEKVFIGKIITRSSAQYASFVFFMLGLTLGIFVNIWYLGVIVFVSAGLAIYNFFSKRLGILKDIIISLIVILIYPIALALTAGGNQSLRQSSLFIFPIWLFLTVMAYEIVRDIVDVPGDSRATTSPFPLNNDSQKTRKTAVLLAFGGLPFAFLPFIFKMCGTLYLGGFLGATFVLCCGVFLRIELLSKALFLEILLITVSSLLDIVVV
jgi:4-hydroxybenzoate polyprenyltransferase